MGLNMRGHVSGPFVSHRGVQRMRYSSEIIDFEPKLTQTLLDTFDANVQPASDKEIEFLQIGAERINDIRVIHRNDGKGIEVSTPATWPTSSCSPKPRTSPPPGGRPWPPTTGPGTTSAGR